MNKCIAIVFDHKTSDSKGFPKSWVCDNPAHIECESGWFCEFHGTNRADKLSTTPTEKQ